VGYVLGIDLGTTYSAAAIDQDGQTQILELGSRSAAIPSMVVLRNDGETLTGEAAERRSLNEPERTAREFKRRLGDPTPLILGGTPYGAEAVTGILLHAITSQIASQRGGPADLIALTHPASYGPFKLDLLEQAVRLAELSNVVFISEPEAAALHYAAQERIEPGTAVAVYDFGGGTFDASVLRKTEDGFEVLGKPEGMERLGGIDFDEAVFQHVLQAIETDVSSLDPADPMVRSGLSDLRERCREAKEALSTDTDAVIRVSLPGIQTQLRITRAEFENIISPRIRETVATLQRAVRSAGLTMEQIDRILLVGGSSRIPFVGALVREMTGRPVAIDAHPKHAVALGAAAEARRRLDSGETSVVAPPASAAPQPLTPPPATPPLATPPPVVVPPAKQEAPPAVVPPPSRVEPAAPPPPAAPPASGRPKWPIAVAAVAVAAVIGAGLFFALSGGDDDETPSDSETPEATVTRSTTNQTSPTTANTAAATSTTAPPPTATLAPNTSRISAIQVVNGRFSVAFEVAGFTPDITRQHVHFFFNSVPPTQAGVPGAGPWIVFGAPSPFTGFAVSDKPATATQMCILVANADHSVRQGTGNCVDLPR